MKISDTYERKARLYPAALALVPPVGIVVWLYGVSLQVESGFVGLLATFGIFYLVASMVRELGKRLEENLFDAWGGKPTTQLLRHRDRRIDPVTKARYHAFLAKRLGINFPSASQERNDPNSADHVYASGVKWLLDQTRDTKIFGLLFKENIAYGFRRNCLGLKPLAIAIASGAVVWVLTVRDVLTAHGFQGKVLLSLEGGAWVSLATSGIMLAVWLLFLTERTMRTAAFTYADMLLRACDVLEGQGPPQVRFGVAR